MARSTAKSAKPSAAKAAQVPSAAVPIVSPESTYVAAEIYETGALQAYGAVLVLSATGTSPVQAEIIQVSGNIVDYLGRSPEQLLGTLLQNCLIASDWLALQPLLNPAAVWVNPLRLSFLTDSVDSPTRESSPRLFEAVLHYIDRDKVWVLELEPLPESHALSAMQSQDCFTTLRSAMGALERSADRAEFLGQAARSVQTLISFDRAMIYQFDERGAGQVIAEVKPADRPSYLHQWFPATDIPAVVRDFYQLNGLRYIPNLTQPATALEPPLHPQTQAPIDLTTIEMRGVTQCCIDFHRNMEVEALLVVPLVQNQRLWGLISCHHYQPIVLRYEQRVACRMLGQFIVSALANYLSAAALADVVQRQQAQAQLIGAIARSTDLAAVIAAHQDLLLDVLKAAGAAVFLGEELQLIGATPDREAVQALMQWAETTHQPSLWQTDCLSAEYPEAQDFTDCGSGVLILQIARPQRYSIIWFRPEVLRTIDWAGDPTALQPDPAAPYGPRASFSSCQETVRVTSLPWQPIERETAQEIRSAITGIMLQKSAELAKLNLELQRSNQELEAFAYAASHDLKEPLRGIYNSVTFLIEDYESILDEVGVDRLKNLMRLSHRMDGLIDVLLKFSRIGQSDMVLEPTNLQAMFEQELAVVQGSQPTIQPQIRVARSLPTIACDPTLTQEVWRNLISNAFKYNDKPEPWIEVGYYDSANGDPADLPAEFAALVAHTPVFFLRDNGIGIRDRHVDSVFRLFKRLHPQHLYGGGTGAGLTIVKKIIERHGGQVRLTSEFGKGSTFYFTLGPLA